MLPGMFGIAYNARVGDRAFGWAGDHVEPGVSIAHADEKSDYALHYLTCIGNEAEVVSGRARGAQGHRDRRARAAAGRLRARGARGPDGRRHRSRSAPGVAASAWSTIPRSSSRRPARRWPPPSACATRVDVLDLPGGDGAAGADHGVGRRTERRVRRPGSDVGRPRADGRARHRHHAPRRPHRASATSTTASGAPSAAAGRPSACASTATR